MTSSSASSAHVPPSLFVDKESVVHYDGDPHLGEEYEDRCLLGYNAQDSKERKAAYPLKLKNALTGRAWTLAHKKPEIATAKLLTDAATDSLAATKTVVATVRSACERLAPLQKQTAFEDFFFQGSRKRGEAVQDYINRREREYERMRSLSNGHTSISEDLRTYFLLRLANVTMAEHKAILGQCANEYIWDDITAAMLIQLDTGSASERGERRWERRAYAAEEAEEEVEHATPSYPAEEDDDDDDVEVLAADLDEFDYALAELNVEDLDDRECETLAAEAQKLGARTAKRWGKPSYKAAREKLAQGKTNRGWQSSIDRHGAVKLDNKDASQKLALLKGKTTCHRCKKKGHWAGDPECALGPRSGKGGGRNGRPGGLLRRAGLALVASMKLLAAEMDLPMTAEPLDAVMDIISRTSLGSESRVSEHTPLVVSELVGVSLA